MQKMLWKKSDEAAELEKKLKEPKINIENQKKRLKSGELEQNSQNSGCLLNPYR